MPDKPPQLWKMPPLIKVYEALGAVADGRVRLLDERRAQVTSSDGSKTYEVELVERAITANDNASYWQGYLGYPAIAMMIARGLIGADPSSIAALRGIPWKELNSRFHNDYARTLSEVARRLTARAADPAMIDAACATVLEAVRQYAPRRGARRRPPSGHPTDRQ
jgi:hypothetical protein